MKKLLVILLTLLVLVNVAAAGSVSVQLKRTNPGVAGKKSAQMIFDIVNTDMTHKLQGFIWCQSPDDAQVTSSYGAGTGAAQYVSPLFFMEKGPSQQSLTLSIEAQTPGNKYTGCVVKYIPYTEKVLGSDTKTKSFEKETTFDLGLGKNIESFIVTFEDYFEAVEDDEETESDESEPAKVSVDVDGTKKKITVGEEADVSNVNIEVLEADHSEALLKISGRTSLTSKKTVKVYQKMNGEETTEAIDSHYRELRLDKTVPFVETMSNPECPKGKNYCNTEEVVDEGISFPKTWIILGAILLVLVVAYILGKTSRD